MSFNIEKIIFINLDKREDRRKEIEKEFYEMDLLCERFAGIVHPISGNIGCGLSHLAVLKLAKERNYKNILIVEDDFTFKVDKEFLEHQLSLFFDSKMKYDVLMLAYNTKDEYKTDIHNMPSFKRLSFAHTGSCYLVNQHYYDKLIDLFELSIPKLIETGHHWLYAIDAAWKELQEIDMWILSAPEIGIQRAGYSDNTERWENYGA
jgi:glycosyl transferase family 25